VVVYEDTDGDGRADKRTVIPGEFGHQDNGAGATFQTADTDFVRTQDPDFCSVEGAVGTAETRRRT
jgi:hypothetical protein